MRKLCDVDEVRKCLDEVTGDDSVYAKGLLEWAIRKRTIDEADLRADERNKTIEEAREALSKMKETCDSNGHDCDRCEYTHHPYHQNCADYVLEQMKGE